MILKLNKNVHEKEAQNIAESIHAFVINYQHDLYFITSSSMKDVPEMAKGKVEKWWVFPNDNQLASREFQAETRTVSFGNIQIGGNTKNTILIAGPCSVESEEQITQSAEMLTSMGLTTLRGGCYKPRTSPYSFQGLGLEGLKLLSKMREKYGLNVITEVRDASQVEEVIEYTDIIQVGSKAMYDQGILRACAQTLKPILIKRSFGATLQEFVQAAEFVLSGGNPNVVLCERGIRTFEHGTRFTLDLCGVAWLKEKTNLPIIIDPSHAMGYAYGIPDLTRACVAMGIDGLLIEVHPTPKTAKSDASQQLNHDEFRELVKTLSPVAASVGYTIV